MKTFNDNHLNIALKSIGLGAEWNINIQKIQETRLSSCMLVTPNFWQTGVRSVPEQWIVTDNQQISSVGRVCHSSPRNAFAISLPRRENWPSQQVAPRLLSRSLCSFIWEGFVLLLTEEAVMTCFCECDNFVLVLKCYLPKNETNSKWFNYKTLSLNCLIFNSYM